MRSTATYTTLLQTIEVSHRHIRAKGDKVCIRAYVAHKDVSGLKSHLNCPPPQKKYKDLTWFLSLTNLTVAVIHRDHLNYFVQCRFLSVLRSMSKRGFVSVHDNDNTRLSTLTYKVSFHSGHLLLTL